MANTYESSMIFIPTVYRGDYAERRENWVVTAFKIVVVWVPKRCRIIVGGSK
jgi:hypothetical protein